MRITPSNTEPGGPWAVIFDMDGTMVDNRAYHEAAWIELGHRYQLPITAGFRNRAAAVYNNFTEICPLRLRELLAWKQCKGQSSAPKPVGAHIAL